MRNSNIGKSINLILFYSLKGHAYKNQPRRRALPVMTCKFFLGKKKTIRKKLNLAFSCLTQILLSHVNPVIRSKIKMRPNVFQSQTFLWFHKICLFVFVDAFHGNNHRSWQTQNQVKVHRYYRCNKNFDIKMQINIIYGFWPN